MDIRNSHNESVVGRDIERRETESEHEYGKAKKEGDGMIKGVVNHIDQSTARRMDTSQWI